MLTSRFRNISSLICFLGLLSIGLAASIVPQTEDIQCYKIGNASLLGFVDQGGRVIQSPRYQYCGRWNAEMLWVRERIKDRFSGRFVDRHGRVVTNRLFGDLLDVYFEMPDPEFRDGVAVVATQPGAYAFLNEAGRVIGDTTVPLFFGRFDRDILGVRLGDYYGFVKKTGEIVVSPAFEDARPFHNGAAAVRVGGKWGIIRTDGQFIVKALYDDLDWFRDEPTCWKFRIGDRWGLLDQLGNELVAAKYVDIEQCKNGIATAKTEDGYVIVDISGQTAVRQMRYEALGSVGVGVVLAKVDGKWGVVSAKQESVMPFRFDAVSGFREDGLCEVREGGSVGLLDTKGRLVCDPVYEQIWSPSDGVFPVQRGGEWGIIDVEGKVLVDPTYERIKDVGGFSDGLAIVKVGDGWGLLNLSSSKLVVPCTYADFIRWNDLFAAEKRGVYTLFSMTGEQIVSAELGVTALPKPHEMVQGYGIVRAKSGTGIITRAGQLALPLEYEDAGIPSEDLIPVKRDGQWGYLDMAGAIAITPQFTDAGSFRDGVAAVKVGGKYGYIDRTGKQVVRPAYADAGYSLHGLLPVARAEKVDGVDVLKWGLVNHQGEVVLPLEYECVEWGDIEDNKTRFYGRICWQQP